MVIAVGNLSFEFLKAFMARLDCDCSTVQLLCTVGRSHRLVHVARLIVVKNSFKSKLYVVTGRPGSRNRFRGQTRRRIPKDLRRRHGATVTTLADLVNAAPSIV